MGKRRNCCAVDFSEPSRLALEKASELAEELHAELILLHVNDLLRLERREPNARTWTLAGGAHARTEDRTADG